MCGLASETKSASSGPSGLLGRLVVLRRDGEGEAPRPELRTGRLRLVVGVELGGGVGVCIFDGS